MKRFFLNAAFILFHPVTSFYFLYIKKMKFKELFELMRCGNISVERTECIDFVLITYIWFAGVVGWIVLQLFSFINSFYVPLIG